MFVSGLVGAACFPKLPPPEDDVDVAVEDPADTADFRVPALDSSEVVEALPDVDIDDGPETSLAMIDIPSDNDAADVDIEVVTSTECEGDGECSERNTVCASWTCVEGRCVAENADDGTHCDDGDKCTDNDGCVEGACTGTPRVCVASSPCVVAAGCFPGTGTCIETPVTVATACDDGDRCTTEDMCASGRCVGGPGPAGVDDLNAALTSNNDGHVFWSVVEASEQGVTVLAQLGNQGTFSTTTSVELPAGPFPRLGFLDLNARGELVGARRWAVPVDENDAGPLTAELGTGRVTNGGLTFGGLYEGAFAAPGSDATLGAAAPESGHSDDGAFVARVDDARSLVWALTVQGLVGVAAAASVSFVGDRGQDRWMPRDDGGGALVLNLVGGETTIAMRDGLGQLNETDVSGVRYGTTALFWNVSANGDASAPGKVASAAGELSVLDGVALTDGGVLLAGMARGGGAAVATDHGTSAIPNSANDAIYVWLAAVNADGSIRWTRSIRNSAQTTGDPTMDIRLAAVGGDGGKTAIVIRAHRNPLFGGVGAPTAALVPGITVSQLLESQWILATISTADGKLASARPLPGEGLVVTGVGVDADGTVIAGNAASIAFGGAVLTRVGGPPRPFIARPDGWARWFVWQPGNEVGGAAPAPVPFWSDNGAPVGLTRGGGSAWIGSRTHGVSPFEVGPERDAQSPATFAAGLAVTRLNSNLSLDCE